MLTEIVSSSKTGEIYGTGQAKVLRGRGWETRQIKITISRSFLHKLDWCQDVLFTCLHNATIHHHLFQHKVNFLQVEHYIKLTLAKKGDRKTFA